MLDKDYHKKSTNYAHNKVRSKSISFFLFFKKKRKNDSSNCISATNKKCEYQTVDKDKEKKGDIEKMDINIDKKTVKNKNDLISDVEDACGNCPNKETSDNIVNNYNEFQIKNNDLKKKRESFFNKIKILQKLKNYKIKKSASTFHTFNEQDDTYSKNCNINEMNNLDDKENIKENEIYKNLNKSKSHNVVNEYNSIKKKAEKLKKKVYLKKKNSKSKLNFKKGCRSEIIENEEIVNKLNKTHSVKDFKNKLENDKNENNSDFVRNGSFDKNNINNVKKIEKKNLSKKSENPENNRDLLYKKMIEKNKEKNDYFLIPSNEDLVDSNEWTCTLKKEEIFSELCENENFTNCHDKKDMNLNYKLHCASDQNSNLRNNIKEEYSKKNRDLIRNIKCNINNNINNINNFLIQKNNESFHFSKSERNNIQNHKKNEEFNNKEWINVSDYNKKGSDAQGAGNINGAQNDFIDNLNEKKKKYICDKILLGCNQADMKNTTNEKEIILKLMYNNNGIFFNKDENVNCFYSKERTYSEDIMKNKNTNLFDNINQDNNVNRSMISTNLHKNLNESISKKFNKDININNLHNDKIREINKNVNISSLNNSYNHDTNKSFIPFINRDRYIYETRNNFINNLLFSKNINNNKKINNYHENDVLSNGENLNAEKDSSILNKYLINPLYNLFLYTKKEETNNSKINENKKVDPINTTKNYTNELQKTYRTMYDICDSPNNKNRNNIKNSSGNLNEFYSVIQYNNNDLTGSIKRNNTHSPGCIFLNNKMKNEHDTNINYISSKNKCVIKNKNIQNAHIKDTPTNNTNYLNKNNQNVYLNNNNNNNNNNNIILNNRFLNFNVLENEEQLKYVENRNYNRAHADNTNNYSTSTNNGYTALFNNSIINCNYKNKYDKNNLIEKNNNSFNLFVDNNNSVNTEINKKNQNSYENKKLKKSSSFRDNFNNSRINYNIDNSYIYNGKYYSNNNNTLMKYMDNVDYSNNKEIYFYDMQMKKYSNNLNMKNKHEENNDNNLIRYNNSDNNNNIIICNNNFNNNDIIRYNNNDNKNNIIRCNNNEYNTKLANNGHMKKFTYLPNNKQLLNHNMEIYNSFHDLNCEENQRYDINYMLQARNEYMKNNLSYDSDDLKNKYKLKKSHSFSVENKDCNYFIKNQLKEIKSRMYLKNDEPNIKRIKSLCQIRNYDSSFKNLNAYQESYIKNDTRCNYDSNYNYYNCNYNNCKKNIVHEKIIEDDGNIFINACNRKLKGLSQQYFMVNTKSDVDVEKLKNENKDHLQRNKKCELINDKISDNHRNINNDINNNVKNNNNNNRVIKKNIYMSYDDQRRGEVLWLNKNPDIEENMYDSSYNATGNNSILENHNYINSFNISNDSDFARCNMPSEKYKKYKNYNIVNDIHNNFNNVEEKKEKIFISHNTTSHHVVSYNGDYKVISEDENYKTEKINYINKEKEKNEINYNSLGDNTSSDIYNNEKLYKSHSVSRKTDCKCTKLKKKYYYEEKREDNFIKQKNNMNNKGNCSNKKFKKVIGAKKEDKIIKNMSPKKKIYSKQNAVEREYDAINIHKIDPSLKVNNIESNLNSDNIDNDNKNIKSRNINSMKSIKDNYNHDAEINYKKNNIDSSNSQYFLNSLKSKETDLGINIKKEKDRNNETRKIECSTILMKKGNNNFEKYFSDEFCNQNKETHELINSINEENPRKILKKIKNKKGIKQKNMEKVVLTNSVKSNIIKKKKKKKKGIIPHKEIEELYADSKKENETNFSDKISSIMSSSCGRNELNVNHPFSNGSVKSLPHDHGNINNNLSNRKEDGVLYNKYNEESISIINEKKIYALKKLEPSNIPEINNFYKEVKIMNKILNNISNSDFLNAINLNDLISIEKIFINNNIYINKQIITSSNKNRKLKENSEDAIIYDNNFSIIQLKHDVIFLKKKCLKIILNILTNNIFSFYEIKIAIILLKFFSSIDNNQNIYPSIYPLSLINTLIQKFTLKVYKKIKKKSNINNAHSQKNFKKLPFNYLFICDGINYLCMNDDSLKNKTNKSKMKLNNLIGYYHYINLNRLTYYLEKSSENMSIH